MTKGAGGNDRGGPAGMTEKARWHDRERTAGMTKGARRHDREDWRYDKEAGGMTKRQSMPSVMPPVVNPPSVMPPAFNPPSVIPDIFNRESKVFLHAGATRIKEQQSKILDSR